MLLLLMGELRSLLAESCIKALEPDVVVALERDAEPLLLDNIGRQLVAEERPRAVAP